MQGLFLKKLILYFGILVISCSIALAGDIALVRLHPFGSEFDILIPALWRDGHTPMGLSDTFIDPSGFDVYWIFPNDRLTESDIEKLYSFVCGGGHLILVPDARDFIIEATNRIFEYETWFDELGRPQAYSELVLDSVPDTIIHYGLGFLRSSFITNFDNRWPRIRGVDTLLTKGVCSIGLEGDGLLRYVGWGGRDCYGEPYDADTAVYDSFAVQIIAGNYLAGEITVVGGSDLFHDYYVSGFTDIITLYDNLQFARQLFACNNRADSAALEQADSTLSLRLFGEFTDFDPDSCEWKFRILHVWPPYEFRGHELGARFVAPNVLEIDNPPIFNPVYDTVEVCLMFLPDPTGETVLWDFPVCDTFKFDYDGIKETATPDHFTISTYPNPFNSAVNIVAPENTTIEIFDIDGKHITKFSKNESIWRPSECVSSGIYLIRATNGINSVSKRVLYIK